MLEEIQKLEKCLVNENIIEVDSVNSQFYKFKLEDGCLLMIGGDATIKTSALVLPNHGNNLLIEDINIKYTHNEKYVSIFLNDMELCFEKLTPGIKSIFVSFGNTIECRINV